MAGIPDPKALEEFGGYLCGLFSKARHACAMFGGLHRAYVTLFNLNKKMLLDI